MQTDSTELKQLVEQVRDRETLLDLLRNGLGWELHPEFATDPLPEVEASFQGPTCRVFELNIQDAPYRVLLVEFGAPYRRKNLRDMLASVRALLRTTGRFAGTLGVGDTVFLVASPAYADVRFVLFEDREGRQPKIRSFDLDPRAVGRTLLDFNLVGLRWSELGCWERAWDVDKLSKEFFRELSGLFFDTVEAVATAISDENEQRLFAQTLFNRLIFLRFVEKKGWLRWPTPQGEVTDGYLHALWTASKDSGEPLWPTRLNALFGAVNHPTSDQIHQRSKRLIGEVQYLNGGLFDDDPRFANPKAQVPSKVFEGLLGPEGLFYRYNFTVEESSPEDVLVAVDPEILGKIFEQLTISSKRHDTGSYYTPREIVQFMCREALVGYLTGSPPASRPSRDEGGAGGGSRPGLPEEKARKLVYEHDDSTLTNQEGNWAFERLKAIKVVDPACGSGAYLLGMLQELYALFEKLRRDDRKFSDDPAKEAHERKLWIIENNLYGVDLQPFATNTAMLRLWLTLLVEDTGDRPQPLPNLEYKIETGDSLLGPDPSVPISAKVKRGRKYSVTVVDHAGRLAGKQQIGDSGQQFDMDVERDDMIEELRRLRERYQNAHGPEKQTVKKDLEAKLAELREKVTGSAKKDPAKFDWRVEFFDVFLNEGRALGFDVVLANPPYVRQELIKDQKPALKAVFGEFFSGTADLYTYFYARAVHLLSPGGMLAFISSNKWFRAAYGEKLRGFMAANTGIRSITDFGELPVFSAATFPMVFVAQKVLPASTPVPGAAPEALPAPTAVPAGARLDGGVTFTQVKSLDPAYPDVKALIEQRGFELPPDAIRGAEWTLADRETLARLRKMEASGVPLGEYVKGKIYYGIKTGFNEAFVIDGAKRAELIAEDPKSEEIIKPLAVGDDVRRWRITKKDRWLIVTKIGVDMSRYPAIFKHLSQWEPQLIKRQDQGEHWWELRACAYYAEFDKPKIVFPEIAMEPRFCFDREGTFTNNKAFIVPIDDLPLLAVLNSPWAWEYAGFACAALGDESDGGRIMLQWVNFQRLPIPRASDADRDAIAALVQKCLDAKAADPNADVSELEAEIDARVEFLYFHQGTTGVPPVSGHRPDGGDTAVPPAFPPFIAEIVKKRGDRLPHWTSDGAVYHVTFRLADSLPKHVLEQFEEERDSLSRRPDLSAEERKRLDYLVSDEVEAYLDTGKGECLMSNPEIADLVAHALANFEGERYRLHAWCVMPNHVHLVLQPLAGHELPHIMHSLKSFTAHEITKKLGRTGAVWQAEYYDHLIRHEGSYSRVIEYVLDNPRKAGLKDWPWVQGNRRDAGATLTYDEWVALRAAEREEAGDEPRQRPVWSLIVSGDPERWSPYAPKAFPKDRYGEYTLGSMGRVTDKLPELTELEGTMACLMVEDRRERADVDLVRVGRLSNIRVETRSGSKYPEELICFDFDEHATVPKELLVANATSLELDRFQFTRTHWSIRFDAFPTVISENMAYSSEIRRLLAEGTESQTLECKSSFAWDVRKGEVGDYLRKEVFVAICAMLNAKGGDLLIGVDDDFQVLGLAPDIQKYGNVDKLVQAIENPFGKTLTPNPIGHVEIRPVEVDGHTILRVHVTPDNSQPYQVDDHIYVRRNSKSKPALTAAEAAIWWPKRQRGDV